MNNFICNISIILILIFILLPNTTTAEDTTTAAEERWIYIQDQVVKHEGKNHKANVYFDRDSIHYKDEVLSIWLKHDYEKPLVQPKLGLVKYGMTMIKISCADRKMLIAQIILMDENGSALKTTTYDSDMESIVPETLPETLYIALCNLYK